MTTQLATLPTDFTPADEPRLWRKLVRAAAKIGFADTAVAAWYCATDPLTPGHPHDVSEFRVRPE